MATLNSNLASSPLDPRIEMLTPVSDDNYELPSTGVRAGQRFIMINNGANSGNYPIISLRTPDDGLVRRVYAQTDGMLVALQDNPSTIDHWAGIGAVSSAWIAYTPTFVNFGTVTNVNCWYRRDGASLALNINFRIATVVAAAQTITIPTGLSIDTAKFNSSANTGQNLGVAAVQSGSTAFRVLGVNGDTTHIGFSSIGTHAPVFSDISAGTGSNVVFTFTLGAVIPINGWTATKG